MIITLIICAVLGFFAMGLASAANEHDVEHDLFLSWFIMFASCCIVVFPLKWLFFWIIA